jgi:fructokinase
MRVLAVGTLVVDIINDPIDRIIAPGEGILTRIGIHPGGCALNVAVDVARLAGDQCEVWCVGAVGDDPLAESLRVHASENGATPLYQECVAVGSSKNVILNVAGEERRHHYDPGSNPHLTEEWVASTIDATPPDVFYMGETASLQGIREHTSQLARRAREAGSMVFLDAVVGGPDAWGDLHDACRFTDVFHCNDAEALAFTGTGTVGDAVRKLVDLGVKTPIVSQGAGDVTCASGGTVYSMPTFSVDCVDGTGAGDAMIAGMIAWYCTDGRRSHDPEEPILFAQAAGASAVTRIGCTEGVTRETVDALVSTQGAGIASRVRILPDNY